MSPLEAATMKLEFQLDVLKDVRTPFKLKFAEKKHLENRLIRDAVGKSHAERVTNAYASEEWNRFSLGLAELENIYEHECLKMEVLKTDYQTKYLLHKETEEQIKRYR